MTAAESAPATTRRLLPAVEIGSPQNVTRNFK